MKAEFHRNKGHSDTSAGVTKGELMRSEGLLEAEIVVQETLRVKILLEKFDRAKILEVYFARLDGRTPHEIPEEFADLYNLDLHSIKMFLLGQHPQDQILHKIFTMMN